MLRAQAMPNYGHQLDPLASETEFSGVVQVNRGDEVELARAYGFAQRGFEIPNEVDTRFGIASGAKSFTALAVVITDAGWITVREVTVDPPLNAEEVRAIGRELTRRFRGRTVQDIVHMERTPNDPLDALHTRARAVTEQIVALLSGRTLYVSGAINMLDHREFWDIETTRELLRTFEQKEKLAELLTALATESGVRVTIGDENPVAAMRECTLVTSTYMYRDQVLGILGVVGPRRLPYPEVISIVSETAQHVTEALSRVRQDLYLPS